MSHAELTVAEAAERIEQEDDVSVEVLDLRTLIPWDTEAVLDLARALSVDLVVVGQLRERGLAEAVEVLVLSDVGERGARTYLDFAARGTDGLPVTVSKRTWRMMRARGLSAASLEGRRVRVRGLLEVRRGPTLEVALDGLETLGETDRPEADPDGERGLRR